MRRELIHSSYMKVSGNSTGAGSRTARPTILRRRFELLLLPLLLALAWSFPTPAAEWPHYRGLNHDGTSTDSILTSFPPEGPPQVWTVPLEPGFSSFTVSGGKAFTLVRRIIDSQDREVCIALNAATGAELWATDVDNASYPDDQAGDDDGPRSTPCVDSGSVYVLSSYLILSKLSASSGALLWQRDLCALYGGQVIPWQNAASPLLDGDFIFINCNSATNCLLALRKTDGSLAWRRGADALTHATPVPATIEGVRQIIFFTQSGLVALAPGTGDELWRYAFSSNTTSTAASPVVDGNIVYCSAGYGCGAGAVQISKSGNQLTATELWRNSLQNQWSTPVSAGGYLYGLFGYNNNSAPLKCIDLATGAEMWSEPDFGPGGILLVDGKLLVTDNRGGVALAKASPGAYFELARFEAVAGKCWNSAAVCDGRLYARSTTEAACLNLSGQTVPAPLVLAIQRPAGGPLCLRVSSNDGNPITPDRLPAIKIQSAASLPPTGWSRLTNSLVLTNGSIEVAVAPSAAHRYFIAVEPPDSSAGLVQSLQRSPDGHLLLHVSSADGNPIAPARFAGITVLSTADFLTTVTGWSCLTNSLTLTNGVIEVNLESSGLQRYFIATEQL